ncbi:TPA: hypothetical protein ACGCEE_002990 [Stenotrophomonas maltophilia]|uniref:hypothetical protein n=1 Tax=Stenotrophomonas maltophilia TaxID=40324 RepID=UPI0021C59264|nr:hypothetical protein [Stenotrophomonas maltophilia]MCU1023740.1 hypothetical protein [Stenotrophomonas maltophilia]MDH1129914.1 hypothetical protein [Stenotrophomonas maltophilia]HEL7889967.1 hypothetical protein [Stenotrophomonas maltophilia]
MTDRPPYASYAASTNDDDDNPSPELSTFLGCLKRIRAGEVVDGLPWPETSVSAGRGAALSRVERSAIGMLTVAEMLHAADRCRAMATPERHLDEDVVEGLFFAVHGLAELECRDVRPE